MNDLSAPDTPCRTPLSGAEKALIKGYCLLALEKTAVLDTPLVLEIMDRLEGELCGGSAPADALKALKDYEFALSDWHC